MLNATEMVSFQRHDYLNVFFFFSFFCVNQITRGRLLAFFFYRCVVSEKDFARPVSVAVTGMGRKALSLIAFAITFF